MGHLIDDPPRPEVSAIQAIQDAHPWLLAWADDRSVWA